MSYETYTTEALVCGSFDRNTADRSFLLFTREAGMLYADARSVREERSRQRFALQDFSLLRVSLVKGKRGWRVGSIEPLTNYYQEAVDKAARGSVVALCRLLRRFVKGEEANQELFDLAIESLAVVRGVVAERVFTETVVSVRLLALLGYVDQKKIPEVILKTEIGDLSTQMDSKHKRIVDKLYTHAVHMSHL